MPRRPFKKLPICVVIFAARLNIIDLTAKGSCFAGQGNMMNQSVLFQNQSVVNVNQPQMHFCFKCRWEGRTVLKNCPRCGSFLYSQTNVRWRGVALIFLGLFMSGLMTAVSVFVTLLLAAAANNPRNNAQFRGSESMLLLMYVVFGALIAGGLTATVGGAWQAIFGRRNMLLMWICAAFLLLAFFVGSLFRGLA